MRHLIVKAALVTAIIGMAPLSAMAQWPERPVDMCRSFGCWRRYRSDRANVG